MGVSGERVTKYKEIQAVIFKISSPWVRHNKTKGLHENVALFFFSHANLLLTSRVLDGFWEEIRPQKMSAPVP